MEFAVELAAETMEDSEATREVKDTDAAEIEVLAMLLFFDSSEEASWLAVECGMLLVLEAEEGSREMIGTVLVLVLGVGVEEREVIPEVTAVGFAVSTTWAGWPSAGVV